MLRAGLVRQTASGIYHLLPLGLRALEKLIKLVDREMQAIGGTKLALSVLTPATQWKASGSFVGMAIMIWRHFAYASN